jgi:hypothetical protein
MTADTFAEPKTKTMMNNTELEITVRFDSAFPVDLRELHAELESKQDYSTWAKVRLSQFAEDEDFGVFHKVVEKRSMGRPRLYTVPELLAQGPPIPKEVENRGVALGQRLGVIAGQPVPMQPGFLAVIVPMRSRRARGWLLQVTKPM